MARTPPPLRALVALLVGGAAAALAQQQPPPQEQPRQQAPPQLLRLPLKDGSLRFAVIGDTGTASKEQYDVGQQMATFREHFKFDFVIMLGDNMYGADTPEDYRKKFELPYAPLLADKVKFYASLGNHDNPTQRFYELFNMGGQRYYTFRPKHGVRFFALDSNYMDKPQLEWIEKELAASASEWKICFFHHPLYSSAKKHGSAKDLRALLEPIFVKHKVDVVFNGHDHSYERIKPQQGIYYFVSGAGGSLRKGDLRRAEFTEAGYDQDFQFMLVEIDRGDMYFQTITRTGQTVDTGVIHRSAGEPESAPASPLPVPSDAPVVEPAPVQPTPSPSASPSPRASPKASPKPRPTPSPTPTPR
jgi:predicted phosphodiesterase